MGRSFKYHRPRGVLSAGAEEPNALLDVARDSARRQPNVRASVQEVFDGAIIQSQNRWPTLGFDIGSINNLLSPFFAAGFYYKTFMWPREAWAKLYEPIIRRAAGLGVAPKEEDPDHYANRFAHCDVLVAGAGAAGLTAALSAAETGAEVILVDERAEVGGSLLFDTGVTIDASRVTIGRKGSGQAQGHAECAGADAHHRVRLLQPQFHRPCGTRDGSPAAPGQVSSA